MGTLNCTKAAGSVLLDEEIRPWRLSNKTACVWEQDGGGSSGTSVLYCTVLPVLEVMND